LEEKDVFVEGLPETDGLVSELVTKLKEARSIAGELATIEISVNDKRQKDVHDYIKYLRESYINKFGHEPYGYHLVARGEIHEFHVTLNL